MTIGKILFFLILILLFSCTEEPEIKTVKKTTPVINFKSINSYPHDITSFTEGFLIHNGNLYESTGAASNLPQTKSLFGIVDLTTGKIDTKVELDKLKYFGEGIAILNGKIYQLTYKAKTGFIYDAITYKKINKFTYPSKEGWGLTTDGTNLIMSDGTNTLTYLNPINLQVVKTIAVSENGYVTDYLNELEYINGYIYANIWTKDIIVKIDPENGKIIGKLDLTTIANELRHTHPNAMEMNGIAFDPTTNRIFITGKLWPKIYEITI